ncbi:OLC1v1007274C1 [Oldenlandia corymbosa var. corymbosa]|uniref:OLC1v1007274C1 n=1 Tax=Oldenlandia corymbosa var. corymbosa TaxID=529605 RepID=A0AAV1DJA4_OLDCO|nr:OLC1v1007274C1 [Oldenlandia corymbosa var. corymbosa]
MVAPDILEFDHFVMEIVGPCNGVVCLTERTGFLYVSIDDRKIRGQAIYLCNPATREYRGLPDSPFDFIPGLSCARQALGFGFDPCAKDYKVASVLYLPDEIDVERGTGLCKIEVYHHSSNSWREVDILSDEISSHGLVKCKDIRVTHPHFLLNGSFHWAAGCRINNYFILCFDMNTEAVHAIPFPPASSSPDSILPRLVVLEDSLALVHVEYAGSEVVYEHI